MKLMITGSFSITDFDLEKYIPSDVELIISSGATGIEALAEKYADEHKISKLILRPNHNKYGRIAELMLTYDMIRISNSILVIIAENSKDAKRVTEIAEKSFKPVTIVTVK